MNVQRACFLVCVVALTTAWGVDEGSEWTGYKAAHGKEYEEREDSMRRGIWETNMAYIRRHNLEADRGQHSYWMGENSYTDMTNKEFRAMMNGYVMSNETFAQSNVQFVANDQPLADAVDWRQKGYVTDVKDQGQCGSCWAFSTTGSLEGQHFKKTGKLVSLSEQQLVDCSNLYGNRGCQGGMMDNAFKYIKANKGIDTEKKYPYVARTNLFCHFKRWEWDIGATLTSYVDVQSGSEKALAQAVSSVGPVSVAMDAGHDSFQHYKTGVYQEKACSSTQLDHGVLVVGFGSDGTQNYWIVKNSWGKSWGEKGYFKLLKDSNNMCGPATQASYPVV